MQQAIANVVSKQVNTMERRMPQALGHPATYEDLLEEMDLSPLAQAIIVTTMSAKLFQIWWNAPSIDRTKYIIAWVSSYILHIILLFAILIYVIFISVFQAFQLSLYNTGIRL